MAKERLLQCSSCSLRTENKCDPAKTGLTVRDFVYKSKPRKAGEEYQGCGCYLPAKASSIDAQCPLGKFKDKENGTS